MSEERWLVYRHYELGIYLFFSQKSISPLKYDGIIDPPLRWSVWLLLSILEGRMRMESGSQLGGFVGKEQWSLS